MASFGIVHKTQAASLLRYLYLYVLLPISICSFNIISYRVFYAGLLARLKRHAMSSIRIGLCVHFAQFHKCIMNIK